MVKGWGLWEVPGSSPNVAKIYLSKEEKKKKKNLFSLWRIHLYVDA